MKPKNWRRTPALARDDAAAIALTGLAFLAEHEGLLRRFMAQTGITASRLRMEAHTEEIQIAVLDHLLADESLLLSFAATTGFDAGRIRNACICLAGNQGAKNA